jgi:hypothetical protein
MTAAEIARRFKSRRSGSYKGRPCWQAKCPCHRDRLASLSITEPELGRSRVNCFAGCDTVGVLAAVGLTVGDLYADHGKPDPALAKRAEQERRVRDGIRRKAKARLNRALEQARYWDKRAYELSAQLMQNPDKIAPLFHRALGMYRKLDEQAVDQMCGIWEFRKDDFSIGQWDSSDPPILTDEQLLTIVMFWNHYHVWDGVEWLKAGKPWPKESDVKMDPDTVMRRSAKLASELLRVRP